MCVCVWGGGGGGGLSRLACLNYIGMLFHAGARNDKFLVSGGGGLRLKEFKIHCLTTALLFLLFFQF